MLRLPRLFTLVAAPEREGEGDDQQNGGEESPWQLTARGIAEGFEATEMFFIGARIVFASGNVGTRRKSFARSQQIFGDGLIFVEADAVRVGPHKSFIKNAAWELVELIFFKRLQQASANFSGGGDFLQGNLTVLARRF